MSEEQEVGCGRPIAASALVGDGESKSKENIPSSAVGKEKVMIQVGQKAPDFTASGYHKGAFVDNVKLSDYLGKWVILCFYPGDFTFV